MAQQAVAAWRPGARRWRAAAFGVMAVLLTACGGGGDASASWPAGGPNGSTGLVPAPAAPGALLVADSAPLRPLRAGTRWQYLQAVSTLQPPPMPEVTMAASGSDRFVESRFGLETRIEFWRTAEGDTFASADVPLAAGRVLRLSGPDLTRELRAGQLIVGFDTRRADIGADLDGDGRPDGADLAFWRVVVGFEDIELPASPRPVRALRLNDQVTVRTLSSRGGVIAVSTQHSSSWYRAGTGLVRTVVWRDAAAATATSDEQLVGYDGIDRGFGFTTLPRAAGSGGQAVPFGSGYLSLSPGADTLVVANARGERVSESPGRRPGAASYLRQLLPTARGMRMAVVFDKGDSRLQFELDAVDAEGRLLPGPRAEREIGPFRLPPSGSNAVLASHPASDLIWVAYPMTDLRDAPGGGLTSEPLLVLHRYSADGEVLGEPLRLPAREFGSTRKPQLLALADRVLLLSPESTGTSEHRFVEVGNDGRILNDRRYALAPDPTSFTRQTTGGLRQVGSTRWMVWEGPGATDTAPRRPYLMRLAPDGTPLDVPDSFAGAQSATMPWPEGLRTTGMPDQVVATPDGWWLQPAARVLTGGVFQAGIAVFDAGGDDPRRQPAARWVPIQDGAGTMPWVTLPDRTLFDSGYGGIFGTEPTTVWWHE